MTFQTITRTFFVFQGRPLSEYVQARSLVFLLFVCLPSVLLCSSKNLTSGPHFCVLRDIPKEGSTNLESFNYRKLQPDKINRTSRIRIRSALRQKSIDSSLYRVVYKGKKGPGKGRHIVFISSDHEYRGEESLPALAKILAKRYGFTCTVIWALDEQGYIQPGGSNIKGLGALKDADLMVIFTRFSNFGGDQMQHIDEYLKRGGPVVGLRTSTHAFRNADRLGWNHYDYKYDGPLTEWHGGFGELVLGETWVGHYGKNHEQASKIIVEPGQIGHPIMRGVKKAWAQCGGYKAYPTGRNLKILARGQILDGMVPTDTPDLTKEELPIAWVRTYQLPSGRPGRAFTTTHGASEDLLSDDFRRMLINACLWAVGLETGISAKNNIGFVGKYTPTTFNFHGYKANVKPADLASWRSHIMPGEIISKKER